MVGGVVLESDSLLGFNLLYQLEGPRDEFRSSQPALLIGRLVRSRQREKKHEHAAKKFVEKKGRKSGACDRFVKTPASS